jgi:hypothetical protein
VATIDQVVASLPRPCSSTVLPGDPDSPAIYLPDEHHGPGDVIDDNIANAKYLVSAAGVQIIGVEGYSSEFDRYTGTAAHVDTHPPARVPGATSVSGATRFADTVCHDAHVVGVDSEGYCTEILVECRKDDMVASHPAQHGRSMHFVLALREEAERAGLSGDMAINCGAAHNDHIMSMARDRARQPAWWPHQARFCRLRSNAFPS